MEIEIFRKLFKNSAIRLNIFESVYSIHRILFPINEYSIVIDKFFYTWKELSSNLDMLVSYKYNHLVRDYLVILSNYCNGIHNPNITTTISNEVCMNSQQHRALEKLIFRAIKFNNVAVVNYVLELLPEYLGQFDKYASSSALGPGIFGIFDHMYYAAKFGRLEIAKILHHHEHAWEYHNAFVAACETSGNIEMVKWLNTIVTSDPCHRQLLKIPTEPNDNPFYRAAKHGQIEILEWLMGDNELISFYGISNLTLHAVHGSQVKILNWLRNNSNDIIKFNVNSLDYSVDLASKNGSIEFIKWMKLNYPEAKHSNDAIDFADNLEILQFLKDNYTHGCTMTSMSNAAQKGDLEMVIFLYTNYHISSTSLPETIMNNAAGLGYLNVVKWLHENTTAPCTVYAMNLAASNGFLKVVRFLHEHRTEGCTTQAMDVAAKRSLEMVKFLNENRSEGCTSQALSNAIAWSKLDIVRYLIENRTEKCDINTLKAAILMGNFDMISYLLENVFHNNEINREYIDLAASSGKIEILKLLLSHPAGNQGFSNDVAVKVTMNGHFHMLKYLYDQHSIDGPFILLEIAVGTQNYPIIKFILERKANQFHYLQYQNIINYAKYVQFKKALDILNNYLPQSIDYDKKDKIDSL